MIKTLEKWYHEWQQKARNRYLAGYYPNHERVPNCVVRGLYGIGYFFGDFVPLILNFIDAVYTTIKRLIAFIVGLLVESSIFIVLIGSIVFSVSHSIERLRQAGATGGLEYIGVLMFEVIFIGSAATLTGFLMKKRKPNGFIEWLGLILTILGFFVGLGFVWWSNVNGMSPTWEGRIIGSLVPLLVLIGEGVLAYRYLSELAEDNQTRLMEIIQRNGLTVGDALKAIEMYLANRVEHKRVQTEQVEHEHVQSEQTNLEQTNTEQTEHEQTEHEQVERGQAEHEQTEQIEHERTEHEHVLIEHDKQLENQRFEHVEQIDQHKQIEHEHEQPEQTIYEQNEHKHEQPSDERSEQNEHIDREQSEQADVEQPTIEHNEQHKIEQTNEHEQKRKQGERVQRKTKLYVVKGRGQSKVDIAIKCALRLIEQNKEFTVRELAEMAGCSLGTAQNAMNKLKQQKLAQ